MNIDDLLQSRGEWLKGKGPKSDIVISSRARLARNLSDLPFSHWAQPKELEQVMTEIETVTKQCDLTKPMPFFRIKDISELDRQFIIERHLMSREHAVSPAYKAILLDKKEVVSIMINEEDHLRAQVMLPGFNLEEAYSTLSKIDDEISSRLNFAYSPKWGYLTACPTNVGTGLRASCMLHLPALVISGQINKVLQAISKLNLAVRGLYGEGTEALGNFFQISNQATLGFSEEDIIDNIGKIIDQLVSREYNAREQIMSNHKEEVIDRVWRAYGILKNAYIITSAETIKLLSEIRIGVDLGLVKEMDKSLINELFIITQPAHLQKLEGKSFTARERDVKRAELIRSRLAKG